MLKQVTVADLITTLSKFPADYLVEVELDSGTSEPHTWKDGDHLLLEGNARHMPLSDGNNYVVIK